MKKYEMRNKTVDGTDTVYRYFCESCQNYVYALESVGDKQEFCDKCTEIAKSQEKPVTRKPKDKPVTKKQGKSTKPVKKGKK